MSAFNAKNLSYNKQEPSFLRKLRAEHGGDRSNVQIARPKKDRLKTGDDDEDEPTVVDEHGESLARGEWEAMLKTEKEGGTIEKDLEGEASAGGKSGSGENAERDQVREKQRVAEIGTSKKRKAVKVIGESATSEQPTGGAKFTETKKIETDAPSTAKKKAKKIKLSFDEPDDG